MSSFEPTVGQQVKLVHRRGVPKALKEVNWPADGPYLRTDALYYVLGTRGNEGKYLKVVYVMQPA